MEDPDLGVFSQIGAHVGLGSVDEDGDVGSDLARVVQDVVAETRDPHEQVLECISDTVSDNGMGLPDVDRLREHPRKLDDGHGTRLTAPILGNAGLNSSQLSPLSVVSHSFPPVVPKQKVPSSSPSNAPRNTPVN